MANNKDGFLDRHKDGIANGAIFAGAALFGIESLPLWGPAVLGLMQQAGEVIVANRVQLELLGVDALITFGAIALGGIGAKDNE